MQLWFLYSILFGILFYKLLNFKENLSIGGVLTAFYIITPERRRFFRRQPTQISDIPQIVNIPNIDTFGWQWMGMPTLTQNQFVIGIYGDDLQVLQADDHDEREAIYDNLRTIVENNLTLRENTLINYQTTNINELNRQTNYFCAAYNV